VDVWERPLQVVRPKNYQHEFYDIQQIPWQEKLRVDRSDARALRDSSYDPYHNLTHEPGVISSFLLCFLSFWMVLL
jgi:hypothetical protein